MHKKCNNETNPSESIDQTLTDKFRLQDKFSQQNRILDSFVPTQDTHTHKLKGPAYCSLQVKMVYTRHLQQATPVQSPGSRALQEYVSGCVWVDCDLRFSHNRRDRGFAVFQFRFEFCKFVICVYPRSTQELLKTCLNVSVRSRSNWILEVLVFKERGKAEYLEKNLLEQGREPTANLTHIWRRRRDLNPEARDLTTAPPLLVSYLFPFYRGTQRDDSSKPLKDSIVKRILVFKRQI